MEKHLINRFWRLAAFGALLLVCKVAGHWIPHFNYSSYDYQSSRKPPLWFMACCHYFEGANTARLFGCGRAPQYVVCVYFCLHVKQGDGSLPVPLLYRSKYYLSPLTAAWETHHCSLSLFSYFITFSLWYTHTHTHTAILVSQLIASIWVFRNVHYGM